MSSISLRPLRCLRSAAMSIVRVVPRRRTPVSSRVRVGAVPVAIVLRDVPVGTYLLEQRDQQRILWRLSESADGDEAP